MTIENIKTPEDILEFMKEHIKYGWLDINNDEHIGNMKNFRKLYRTATTRETLEYGIGTCIEQVKLMSELLNKIKIPNKMFCTRVYEGEDFNDLDSEEHMHCFVIYYLDDKVFQIEHPNFEKKGIYEYNSEEEAIKTIVDYYIKLRGGKDSPTKEFFNVPEGISFKEFNKYINHV